ncbi:hypothetical protein [Dialister invisus]|nr:hypothetical protein [Dialister invisus]
MIESQQADDAAYTMICLQPGYKKRENENAVPVKRDGCRFCISR